MKTNRIQLLESAKKESLVGNYNKAICILKKLLGNNANDIDALILNGNVLELGAFARELDGSNDKNVVNDMMAARDCYCKVLSIQPDNIRALHDLAQNYKNMGELSTAILKYKQLINLINSMKPFDIETREELDDALLELSEIEGNIK